jgi:hypothetical protein
VRYKYLSKSLATGVTFGEIVFMMYDSVSKRFSTYKTTTTVEMIFGSEDNGVQHL